MESTSPTALADLVRRAQKGDEAAQRELIVSYQHRVAGFVYAMTGRSDYVEDLSQQVFIKMIRALDRLQAPAQYSRAVEAARRASDALVLSEAADALGMVHWRRYQAVADRRQLINDAATLHIDEFLRDPRGVAVFLESRTIVPQPASGEGDYRAASELFAEALRANPGNARAVRHSLMALVERGRWGKLSSAATKRLGAAPWDPVAWLAAGLAHWRVGSTTDAAAAFDSALLLAAPDDRRTLLDLARILRPTDSASYAGLTEAQRALMNWVYWTAADPLALVPGNDLQLEFLARVAEAELRWSSDEGTRRGADSDRGAVLIRFGPPPVVASFAPSGTPTQSCPGYRVDFEAGRRGVDVGTPILESCASAGDPASALVLWFYPDLPLHFVFRAPPSYGSAMLVGDYRERLDATRAHAPVRWDNVPVVKGIDSLPVMIARFRAAADSTDLLLFGEFGTSERMEPQIALNANWLAGVVIRDRTLRVVAYDTVRIEASSTKPAVRRWTLRIPSVETSYRVEGVPENKAVATRAGGALAAMAVEGFAMSDIATASRVTPTVPVPRRWTDLEIEGGSIIFGRDSSFVVVWETYDLASDSGVAKYRVDISLSRVDGTSDRPLLVRVVRGAADVLGLRKNEETNRATVSYDRSIPHAPIVLDYLTLSMPEAAAGSYRLAITVADLVTGRIVETSKALTLR